ncbi:probable prolyl 4-hydroxylase 10 [Punica granatum]|uniref:Probable prolyl 4-hydroxylase 10 n=1 Tax=Punica granatum TaxID=22663 RepID=A0A6P8DDR5_PUNGR|nr:probable prolyl 4-hydroxylase 10 [Punica granatum]
MLVLTMLLMLSLVMILLPLVVASMPSGSSNVLEAHDLTSITQETTGDGGRREQQWVEAISWEPRAFMYHNFLKEECEYLIKLGAPHMQKSTAVDSSTGKIQYSRCAQDLLLFLVRGRDKIIWDTEKRIADFSFTHTEHREGLQVFHYEVGQKYEPHFDYFLDEYNTRNGGQRMATIIMYLSDV